MVFCTQSHLRDSAAFMDINDDVIFEEPSLKLSLDLLDSNNQYILSK